MFNRTSPFNRVLFNRPYLALVVLVDDDSGVGVENYTREIVGEFSILEVFLTPSDSGSGLEALGDRILLIADVGSGNDISITIPSLLQAVDSGIGLDSSTLHTLGELLKAIIYARKHFAQRVYTKPYFNQGIYTRAYFNQETYAKSYFNQKSYTKPYFNQKSYPVEVKQ